MKSDAVLARELAALREELQALRRERPTPATDADTAGTNKAAGAAANAGEAWQIPEQFGDFLKLIKEFTEEAEHNVAEHPAASVVGALLLGILIGRMLGKR